jgi:hypothetical protein
LKQIFTFLLIAFIGEPLSAQKCDSSFFANTLTAEHNIGISVIALTRNQQDEVLCTGGFAFDTYYAHSWISKSTSKGNIIWARQYSQPKFDNIDFNHILPQADGSSIITGTVFKLDRNTRIAENGILFLKIDKYGKIIWSKLLGSHHDVSRNQYSMGNIVQTSDGDFVLNILVVKDDQSVKYYSSNFILRISVDGTIKWARKLSSPDFMLGNFGLANNNDNYNRISQLPDGNISFGSIIDDYDYTTGVINKIGYYFSELDYATGNRIWDNSYLLPPASGLAQKGVQKITALPGGDISFIADIIQQTGPKLIRRPLDIITDAQGNIKSAVSYYNSISNADCDVADVLVPGNNGGQLILSGEDFNKNGLLISIDKNGNLFNYSGFIGANGAIGHLAYSLIAAKQGYYMATSDRSLNEIHLFNIDTSKTLGCVDLPVKIISESATGLLTKNAANMKYDDDSPGDFLDGGLISQSFDMHSVTDCNVVTCCSDIIDTVRNFELCDQQTITLPDNTVVKDTGTYYISYKTPGGCDSIALYTVSTPKGLSNFTLTKDTCIAVGDSVILRATEGFGTYYWMNQASSKSTFTVRQPGIYYVSVTTPCGQIRDSVQIFDKCDDVIYMPNAFTPNGDGVNDTYRIPPENKNSILTFTIYNRFGQVLFSGDSNTKGWDGTFKHRAQPMGAYVYYLVMKGHTGKILTSKGSFVLIR